MSLRDKSAEELSSLLTHYRIRHGPVLDSTRRLYEKKLDKAMKDAAVKPSSDKTFYREEVEEVTFITYHPSVQHEGYTNMSSNSLKQRGRAESDDDDDDSVVDADDEPEPPVERTHRAANHRAAPTSEKKKTSGVVGTTIKALVLLLVLAVLFYYILCRE